MMGKKLIEQKQNWKQFVEFNSDLFDEFFYQNYLKACEVLDVEGDKIIISVPSTYTKKILLEKGIDQKFQNNNLVVVFTINQDWSKTSFSKTIKKLKPQSNDLTFANLVMGKFNKGVVSVAWKILAGDNIWSPFFVYSEPGLGKTHILKAIENEAKKINKTCCYIHANTFGNLLLEKFNEGSNAIEELKNSFNKYEIILFDDVQLLARREKTNEVLFQIFCNAIDQKKQVVFSSDQHPEELSGFEKRLKSRFINGLILKIDYPDYETAIKIVENKATKIIHHGVNKVDSETINYIAKNFKKDIRKIEGIIKKIAFKLLENPNQEINLTEFQKIFADQTIKFENKVSPKTIKKAVAKFYSVNYNAVISGSRKSEIVKAKCVSMYLIRCLTDENYASIAAQFNAKTHTTAVHAIKKIKNLIKSSPEVQREISHLKKQICQNE